MIPKENKTVEVLVRIPSSKLSAIKKKQGKKGLSNAAYITLCLDSYLNPINEEYYI